MFESAEIGHAIDKDAYDAAVPALREALLEAQFELKQQSRFPVIVLINGVEGAGKGETVKLLNEWMEPRQRHPHAAPLTASLDNFALLASLDMTQRLEKNDYEEQLAVEQARLSGLMRDKRFRQHALVAVFEGNDAAGKGGAIRRMAAALDPRQ